jgi:hypothetical protein
MLRGAEGYKDRDYAKDEGAMLRTEKGYRDGRDYAKERN